MDDLTLVDMRAFGIYRRPRILIDSCASLVGSVTKNMRLISVDWDDAASCLYFYLNGEISEEDSEIIDDILVDFTARFTAEEMSTCDCEIIRSDVPEKIYYKGVCIFARKDL